MLYTLYLSILMENKQYGFFDNHTITTTSNNLNNFPKIIDQTTTFSYIIHEPKLEPAFDNSILNTNSVIQQPKLEPSVENTILNTSDNENATFNLDDFSSNFDDSLLSDSLHNYENDGCAVAPHFLASDLFIESPFAINRASSFTAVNPCELKRLLKIDVLSPVSIGSSYQSVNENVSIDSSQSNQTLNSVAHTNMADFCVICGDLATGKHYGVAACEGCKGFFKRTIRKNLQYSCRERNVCPITEKLRNRCQSCRFSKCLEKGMKIEAVQKERTLKQKLSPPNLPVNGAIPSLTSEDILQNEMLFYCVDKSVCDSIINVGDTKLFCSVINKQLFNLVMWAKSVPGFSFLERSDQMILLNNSWVEILIASFSFQSSMESEFGIIKMDETHLLTLSTATEIGLQNLMIRILRESIVTLKYLQVDQMEIACLKTIILFDSNYSDLKNPDIIKQFRHCIFGILKNYVSEKYPKQPTRIYKLLLKLPSMRGLTACFLERMKIILCDSLLSDSFPQSPRAQSNSGNVVNDSQPDLLYPLFSEMMKQKDYPYL